MSIWLAPFLHWPYLLISIEHHLDTLQGPRKFTEFIFQALLWNLAFSLNVTPLGLRPPMSWTSWRKGDREWSKGIHKWTWRDSKNGRFCNKELFMMPVLVHLSAWTGLMQSSAGTRELWSLRVPSIMDRISVSAIDLSAAKLRRESSKRGSLKHRSLRTGHSAYSIRM